MPQCLRALEVGVDLGFDFADDGQVAVDFGDYSSLFSYRRPINLRFDLLTLGAQDMANYLAHSYQWDATSGIMEDWMYEKYAAKYAFDKEIQDWMRDVNPWALQRLTEILLEAEQRGLWNAKPETKAELQKIYLSLEGELEERNDG